MCFHLCPVSLAHFPHALQRCDIRSRFHPLARNSTDGPRFSSSASSTSSSNTAAACFNVDCSADARTQLRACPAIVLGNVLSNAFSYVLGYCANGSFGPVFGCESSRSLRSYLTRCYQPSIAILSYINGIDFKAV